MKRILFLVLILLGSLSGKSQCLEDCSEVVDKLAQFSVYGGANRYSSKEFGMEGIWKKNFKEKWYFNTGISLAVDHTPKERHQKLRNMIEIGVPLQVELGRLRWGCSSLYGLIGVVPTFYATLNSKVLDPATKHDVSDGNQVGLLISPQLEGGINFPLKRRMLLRVGIYFHYKLNCTTGGYDVYKEVAGNGFIGPKAALLF